MFHTRSSSGRRFPHDLPKEPAITLRRVEFFVFRMQCCCVRTGSRAIPFPELMIVAVPKRELPVESAFFPDTGGSLAVARIPPCYAMSQECRIFYSLTSAQLLSGL